MSDQPKNHPATQHEINLHRKSYLRIYCAVLTGMHAGNIENELQGALTHRALVEQAREGAKLALARFLEDAGYGDEPEKI